ncbi:MAG: NAD(P)H-dependent oxidoreductase [Nannocystaceae bacterium]
MTTERAPSAPTILAFAGSARRGSLNKRLARAAASAAEAEGAAVTFIDLADFEMPIYHGDLEEAEGVPAAALRLAEVFRAHQGLLIASPENNASVSSLLKNTIDWLSRPGARAEGNPFAGKVAGLLAASPGALGGLRGLVHVRAICQTLGVLALPEQFALPAAHEAFDDEGHLKDPKRQKSLVQVVQRLCAVTRALASG